MPSRYFGKYTGIVQDNRDDKHLGRLQLSIPAIYPADTIMVARPALPYGVFFVPENGAKVWVEFEGGDIGLPLWTGVQYVAGEWADEAKASPPSKRVIKTASAHLIILDDTEGDESITVQDGVNGHQIRLDSSGVTLIDGVNNHTVTLDSSGMTLASGGDIVLTGTNITIEASGTFALKGNPLHLNP